MKTGFEGTIRDGALDLDERIEFADQCRVHVTIIPVDQWMDRWKSALAALDELRSTNPIDSGGLRFTRDQLHERR
ncbi:MAG: hypothetical protein WD468_03435 [Pirellulales bacterium]